MTIKLKSILLTLFAFLAFMSISYSQVSLEAGLSLPMGDYSDENGGDANLGYNIRGGWDNLFTDNLGLATGIVIGSNAISKEDGFDVGSWFYVAFEAGLLFKASENFNVKGMLVRAGASTPEISLGNQVLFTSASSGAFGFDIRVEYELDDFYISANFLSFKPEFEFDLNGFQTSEKQSMTTIGIGAGYKF